MSALKSVFCDLETQNLLADLEMLSATNIKTLVEPLKLKALQFSRFIPTILDDEAGEQLIFQAMRGAKASIGLYSGE